MRAVLLRRITIGLAVLLVVAVLLAIRLRHDLDAASDAVPWDEAAVRAQLTDPLVMTEADYRVWLEQIGFTVPEVHDVHAARHSHRGFPCGVDWFVTWTPEGDRVTSVDILGLPARL